MAVLALRTCWCSGGIERWDDEVFLKVRKDTRNPVKSIRKFNIGDFATIKMREQTDFARYMYV